MSRNKKITKICQECGKSFHPAYQAKGLYCSNACRIEGSTSAALKAPLPWGRKELKDIPSPGTWERANLHLQNKRK
jgi:hypothetical protein